MSIDTRIRLALANVIADVDVPNAPIPSIVRTASLSTFRPTHHSRGTATSVLRASLAAAASVVAFAVVVPKVAPAVVTSLEERYRDALHALGGNAPPPAPDALVAKLGSQSATLATARSRVPFTIVAPTGLPRDVVSTSIGIAPSGVYSKATHTWSLGRAAVTFVYKRANGRDFAITADKYDLRAHAPPRVVFVAEDPTANGTPVISKHENFSWRNGDQIISVVADENLSAAEIEAMRLAMNGAPVAERASRIPGGATGKLRLIRRP